MAAGTFPGQFLFLKFYWISVTSYPASLTAFRMLSSETSSVSLIAAVFFFRFAFADFTPSSSFRASSTCCSQWLQVIPSTNTVFFSATLLILSFFPDSFSFYPCRGRNRFSRNALVRTDTELNAMAPAAIIGFKRGPPNRYNNPAAIGIPAEL